MPFKQKDELTLKAPTSKRKPGGKMPIPTFVPGIIGQAGNTNGKFTGGVPTVDLYKNKRPFKK